MRNRLGRRSIRLAVIGAVLFLNAGWAGVRAEDDKVPNEKTVALLKTFADEFVAITPGEGKFPAAFQMGSAKGDAGDPFSKGSAKGDAGGQPQHGVTFKHQFAIAKYEVPQNLYEAVMGGNPSKWKGPRNSVEMMSWHDANEFCGKITAALRKNKLIADNEVIRLPTEAEWEYCCRAGTTTQYSFGDEAQQDGDKGLKATLLDKYGWHTGNAAGNDPPVGALKPNQWGLYDMHGYLWEFTADGWSDAHERPPTDGSAVKASQIVLRSGSWKDSFPSLASTSRRQFSMTAADDAVGFRCVKARVP